MHLIICELDEIQIQCIILNFLKGFAIIQIPFLFIEILKGIPQNCWWFSEFRKRQFSFSVCPQMLFLIQKR